MSKNAVLWTLTVAALFAPLRPSRGAIVYRSSEGWTVEGDDTQVASNAAEQMHRAEQFEAQGNDPSAYKSYRALVKRFGNSFLAPKAQRKVGLLLEKHGDNDKAYDAYNFYLTKYPRGEDFDTVLESTFKIAKLFLEGEKRRVFGVPIAASMERAQTMFEGIVKTAPFSKWAPLAQFDVGQALEKQAKYPEAIQAYQVVVSRYGSDPIADDALYQVAYVRYRAIKEGSYDRASAQKAREAFEDFIARYPTSEKVPQARENMKMLETGVSKGTLEIAKFYDKTKQYKAAVIYYNDVIKNEAGTPNSDFARNRIEALKSLVGEDALRAGPERTETGGRAVERRKLQAKIDTVSRPDYVGPPVIMPEENIERAPSKPRLRSSPDHIGPVPAVEPPLPAPEKMKPEETGLPQPPP